jgi:hypothetical protein
LHAEALAKGEADHAALIVRLAQSEPMKWVWNEMTKKHPTGEFVHPASLGDPWTEALRLQRRLASRIRSEGNERKHTCSKSTLR